MRTSTEAQNNSLPETAGAAAAPAPAHPFATAVNPYLAELLQRLALDKRYVGGRGTEVWDSDGNRYLDFVSAYGSLPFGHNPQSVWKALLDMQASDEVSMIQPSYLDAAGALAERLLAVAPEGFVNVTFANSGAEAVEAAIKACRSATGKPTIVATTNGFHGKTFGALSATARPEYQSAFFAPAPGFEAVPYGDLQALEAKLEETAAHCAAVILEPIQGEGGVVVPPAGYLRGVRALCDRFGVLLILDEVQTGLGRTGKLFACEHEGVRPDAMTLAKALGGGLMPIGAVLLGEKAYNAKFALKHSSTFAGNGLACRAGLAALETLTQDGFVDQVATRGAWLKAELERVASKYPQIFGKIRGQGLMLGIEFHVERKTFLGGEGALLGFLGENESLTPLVASYLLNVEKVRVMPTLNGRSVLRIQPPLTVTEAECRSLVTALERVAAILAAGRTDLLVGHLVGQPAIESQVLSVVAAGDAAQGGSVAKPRGDAEEGRFAFLVHLLGPRSYAEVDPSLERIRTQDLVALSERWNGIVEPSVIGSAQIQSQTGARAYGEFIALQRTADQMMRMSQEEAVDELKQAVDLAQKNGAKIIGLGGFTSVVSQAGRLLTNAGVPLTTGNSFTTLAAIDAVKQACARLSVDLGRSTVSILGAGGSIGSAASRLLASDAGELVLVGNPAKPQNTRFRMALVIKQILQRLRRMEAQGELTRAGRMAESLLARAELPKLGADEAAFLDFAHRLVTEEGSVSPIRVSLDAAAASAHSPVLVTATSSTEALIRPETIRKGAIICDVSRPANVAESMTAQRPDVLVIDGGVVQVPNRPDLGWGFGFPRGLAYACMCETMMLGLERRYEHISLGADLEDSTLDLFAGLAKKHGFEIAELRQFGKPVAMKRWDELLAVNRSAV